MFASFRKTVCVAALCCGGMAFLEPMPGFEFAGARAVAQDQNSLVATVYYRRGNDPWTTTTFHDKQNLLDFVRILLNDKDIDFQVSGIDEYGNRFSQNRALVEVMYGIGEDEDGE
jgi:hypothetical protein